jgi:hypothetical protein
MLLRGLTSFHLLLANTSDQSESVSHYCCVAISCILLVECVARSSFLKVMGEAPGVSGKWLVLHFPCSNGKRKIHQS